MEGDLIEDPLAKLLHDQAPPEAAHNNLTTATTLGFDVPLVTSDYCPLNGTNESCSAPGVVNNGTTESSINMFYFYEVETLTFLGILLFFIVIGNSAVLAALMMGKTQRKSRMNFFIMHLALADLAVGLINVLTDIIWKVTVSWYLGNIACKIIKYFQTVVIYASNYVLVALSIDRYDAITHPLKFSGSYTYADASLYVKDALLTSDLSACEKSGRRKKKDRPSNTLPVHPSETSHVSVTAPAEVPVIVPAEVPVALVPEVPTLVLVSDDSVEHNPRSSNQNFVILPRQEAHHCNCEEFQKDVLLKLQVLEECFLQQTELLRCVLEKLTNKPVDNCVEGEYKFEHNQFPIKDMNSLDDLIQLVTDNKKAYEELVRKMTICGGSTIDDAMKLIFKMLFSDEVLAGHCFKGQSTKRAFINYVALLEALKDSLRKNGRIMQRQDVSQDSVNLVIPKLLKKAADRLFSKTRNEARLHPGPNSRENVLIEDNRRRARLLIASAWGCSFTFALPSAFLFHEENLATPYGPTVTQCWIDMSPLQWQVYMTIISIALFIIPAFIIAICYTIMVHTIWTQSRILTPSSKKSSNGILRRGTCKTAAKSDDDDSRRASSRGLIPKAKIKSVKMTFVIVFVFICCSSPYVVFSLLQVYDFIPKTQTMTALSTFFQGLSPLNSAANPIVYCLFSTHICKNLRKIRFINWLAMRCCPNLGKMSPTTGNKRRFGAGTSNQDTSQKRTDFSSLTESLMTRSDRITQSTLRSSNNGIRRHEGPGSILNKERATVESNSTRISSQPAETGSSPTTTVGVEIVQASEKLLGNKET